MHERSGTSRICAARSNSPLRQSPKASCSRRRSLMALDISKEKGVALDRQVFTWRELAGRPYSKLDDDAFTRVRVIFMNGIESEALRFSHSFARMNKALAGPLPRVRPIRHHHQPMVNGLNPP